MTYKVHLELNVVNAETGRGVAMARRPGDARRIAALLSKAAGLTVTDIEALPDGGLALVIEERNAAQQMLDQALARERRLRAALEGMLRRAHTLALRLGDAGLYDLPDDMAGGVNPQAFDAARAALADDA